MCVDSLLILYLCYFYRQFIDSVSLLFLQLFKVRDKSGSTIEEISETRFDGNFPRLSTDVLVVENQGTFSSVSRVSIIPGYDPVQQRKKNLKKRHINDPADSPVAGTPSTTAPSPCQVKTTSFQ